MSRFQQTGALVTGVGLLVSFVVLFAVVGLEALTTETLIGVVVMLLAATAYVLAGTRETLDVGGTTVKRNQLSGVGTILLAVGWAIASVPLATSSPVFGVAILLGAALLVFLGYNELTDGPHIDLEASPSQKRLVAVAAIALLSFGIGFVLVAVVF